MTSKTIFLFACLASSLTMAHRAEAVSITVTEDPNSGNGRYFGSLLVSGGFGVNPWTEFANADQVNVSLGVLSGFAFRGRDGLYRQEFYGYGAVYWGQMPNYNITDGGGGGGIFTEGVSRVSSSSGDAYADSFFPEITDAGWAFTSFSSNWQIPLIWDGYNMSGEGTWELTVNTRVIPDATATITLLGGGLLWLVALRRRLRA